MKALSSRVSKPSKDKSFVWRENAINSEQ